MNSPRRRYLERMGVAGPWQIDGAGGAAYAAAVVIPACDEEDWLFQTLASLAKNPRSALQQTLILVVLNQPLQAPAAVRAANARTLDRLKNDALRQTLQLAWIDAVGPGLELPRGGAGAARRLGLDRALTRLAQAGDPVLICLDADTLVESTYLPALMRHFAGSPAGGAVLPFAHQPAASVSLQAAIDRYELFLRCYLLGMQLAGSPYAFPTIGSAMACRASAYVRCGGMPPRAAGEDFYFLQKLAKTSGLATVNGTCVYPAARLSSRVPFGTGPTLARLQADADDLLFYPLPAFLLLGDVIRTATNWMADGEGLQRKLDTLQPDLGLFLREQKLAEVIDRLRLNHPGPGQFVRAFHGWFDGLKSLRLLRRLCGGTPFFMASAEQAVPQFFAHAGLSHQPSLALMLKMLRIDQNKG